MATITKKICDRCGAEFPSGIHLLCVKLSQMQSDEMKRLSIRSRGEPRTFDLCHPCERQLADFLASPKSPEDD